MGLPFRSTALAWNCAVAPRKVNWAVGGSTSIVAGCGSTVTPVSPDTPSSVARTVVEPGVTAVIKPLSFTVTTAVLLDIQVGALPAIGLPCASTAAIWACCVAPIASSTMGAGLIVTVAAGPASAVAVNVAMAVPIVAVAVCWPAAVPRVHVA